MGQLSVQQRVRRAQILADAGSLAHALEAGTLSATVDLTLSEIIVLGLWAQGVKNFIGIFGHGSTDVGDVLRVYEDAGLVKMYAVRHETAAVHAATALRWVTGEKAAVVTSIGPGALHALAGALTPASNGIGVWFLLGDETTEDEGPNMQQVPRLEQNLFPRMFSAMGPTYSLHTPGAASTALRRGLGATEHPYRPSPFFLLLPMNAQPQVVRDFNFREIPLAGPPRLGKAADDGAYENAARAIADAKRVVVKIGGGARMAGSELAALLELADGAAVHSPLASGVLPFEHPRNMTVGGSKGTISGNFAMEAADLLIACGTRFVCQSDCSRTGYPKVKTVININGDPDTAIHYGDCIALVGDVPATIGHLNQVLKSKNARLDKHPSEWFQMCVEKRRQWDAFRAERYRNPVLYDAIWDQEVLTQPAVIKAATDWARANGAVAFFDAGDVQANGFQVVEDDRIGRTFTDTGASYMGFAVSSLMATAMTSTPFYGLALTGDGSFTMNPQILIDGVEHGAQGCILLLDNRRMGAISGLQSAQYDAVYATSDQVTVDYVAWAHAIQGVQAFHGGYTTESLITSLDAAHSHGGLALIHVPVYFGPNPLGGMGVFGRWNVGNWCEATQALRHKIGL